MQLPTTSDDGRSGTLFGQRVSAEFVMALIAQMGGRAEVNMFLEIENLRRNGVRIVVEPKYNMMGPDRYHLEDRHGAPWPPAPAPKGTPALEEGVIEGEIVDG
jgi:hypothetical protein